MAHTDARTDARIDSVTLEVTDLDAARSFYDAAFGLGDLLRLRTAESPATGFRGYTLSLTVAQPSDVNALFGAAVAAGATPIKPVAKSLWGHGGVVQAPDGSIWKVATSAKKDSGPATGAIDQVVLLIGSEDVSASKRFYVDRGLHVGKSFGSYVDFDMPASPIKLGLYKHRALAKDAGVPPEGAGSHRVAVNSNLGSFTDPDGFAWEQVRVTS